LVEETELEVKEYRQLSTEIQKLKKDGTSPTTTTTVVDLGYQTVSCPARIEPNLSQLFVHVGLGFHVEFTAEEALLFVDKRIDFVKTNKLAYRQKQLISIQDHVQSSMNVLRELERVRDGTM